MTILGISLKKDIFVNVLKTKKDKNVDVSIFLFIS